MKEFIPSDISHVKYDVKAEVDAYFEKFNLPIEEKAECLEEQIHVAIATLMYKLVDLTNHIDSETIVKGMLEGMNRNHRTLQSEFMNVMIRFMTEYSKQDPIRFFDGRNQHVPVLMTRMLEAMWK